MFKFDLDKSWNTYEKTPLPRLSLVWKVRDAMPPLSDVPACRCQQSLSRCITC